MVACSLIGCHAATAREQYNAGNNYEESDQDTFHVFQFGFLDGVKTINQGEKYGADREKNNRFYDPTPVRRQSPPAATLSGPKSSKTPHFP
jgi:hypothetical protein